MQNGHITDKSVYGAAIVNHGPLPIDLGESVKLRVENFEQMPNHMVFPKSGNYFSITFELKEIEVHETFDLITSDET
jgi:hypothetical protein